MMDYHKIICTHCGHQDGMARADTNISNLTCPDCRKKGTHRYVQKRSKAMWKLRDRVMVDFEGELYPGTITKLMKTKAKVSFDDGEVYDLSLKELQVEEKPDSKPVAQDRGFNQYDLIWDKAKVNFKFKADGAVFYGWWRRVPSSEEKRYGVDLMVVYQDHTYNVETLCYFEEDPRNNLRSLNADICAAANKWFYQKCKGTFQTIEDLRQQAAKPTIKITRLATLDALILKMKEYRDTAIRCGGRRVMTFSGDHSETEPSMRIELDLTTQALGFDGKVPSLLEGAALDEVTSRGKNRKTIEKSPDSINVDALLKKLANSKDKAEQRKLRSILRKMGHKGGARKRSN